ncbi:hypothetical protein J6590_076407 [Homalodisca vitripennis]|nr:hypothetical protein J6590_076407 [Homalodisca vitripennis]
MSLRNLLPQEGIVVYFVAAVVHACIVLADGPRYILNSATISGGDCLNTPPPPFNQCVKPIMILRLRQLEIVFSLQLRATEKLDRILRASTFWWLTAIDRTEYLDLVGSTRFSWQLTMSSGTSRSGCRESK